MIDEIERAISSGRQFVFIADAGDGQLIVSGPAKPEWLALVLDAVRAGLPTIDDVPQVQTRIIETN